MAAADSSHGGLDLESFSASDDDENDSRSPNHDEESLLAKSEEKFTHSSTLRFRVMLINSHGTRDEHLLAVNSEDRWVLLVAKRAGPVEDSKRIFSVDDIPQVQTPVDEPRRLILMVMTALERPLDMLFDDESTRNGVLAMLRSLRPSIVCKEMSVAPKWVPDGQAERCMRCHGEPFTYTNRRHHCRYCGYVVCRSCSGRTAVLPDFGYDRPVRVCDDCFTRIRDSRALKLGSGAALALDQSTDEYDHYGFEKRRSSTKSSSRHAHHRQVSSSLLLQQQSAQQTTEPQDVQRQRWNDYLVHHPELRADDPELKALVRKGIPRELRGMVWQMLSGSKARQENASPDYYTTLLRHAADQPERTSNAEILKDLHRTFPGHRVYETEEGIETLRRVLVAYSLHNPHIGYCQSMNFVCALLLLFMEEEDAFWMMITVVEHIAIVRAPPDCASAIPHEGLSYYSQNLLGTHIDQAVFLELLDEYLPRVTRKLRLLDVPLEPLTVNWFLCLFVNALPLETNLRVWDCMFAEGIKMLFRTALTMMRVNEKRILAAKTMEEGMLALRGGCSGDQFVRLCFDDYWFGSFPWAKLERLRAEKSKLFITMGDAVDDEMTELMRELDEQKRKTERDVPEVATAAGADGSTGRFGVIRDLVDPRFGEKFLGLLASFARGAQAAVQQHQQQQEAEENVVEATTTDEGEYVVVGGGKQDDDDDDESKKI